MKSCKSHETNKTNNIRPLVFGFSPIDLTFWCSLFCFFCGLQDFKFWYVNRIAFAASFLYWVDFTYYSDMQKTYGFLMFCWKPYNHMFLLSFFRGNCQIKTESSWAIGCFSFVLESMRTLEVLRYQQIKLVQSVYSAELQEY